MIVNSINQLGVVCKIINIGKAENVCSITEQ